MQFSLLIQYVVSENLNIVRSQGGLMCASNVSKLRLTWLAALKSLNKLSEGNQQRSRIQVQELWVEGERIKQRAMLKKN